MNRCINAENGKGPANGLASPGARADNRSRGSGRRLVFACGLAGAALIALLAFTTLSPLPGLMLAIIVVAAAGLAPRSLAFIRRPFGIDPLGTASAPDRDQPDPVSARLAGGGYLTRDVAAGDVVREDARRLVAAGTSSDAVSERLGTLFRSAVGAARAQARFGEFLRGDKWLADLPPVSEHFTRDDISVVLAPFTLDVERCAWGCRLDGPEPGSALIVNRESAEYCHVGAVALHYICRHGFFGDLGSPYRTDPVALALGLTRAEGRGVRRVGEKAPRAWEAWMLDPFRAASVELALLDIYSSYKEGNTTPYLVARDGADAGRVWPLTGAAIGISPSGAVVGAPDAPTRLVPSGHGVVISGDGMTVNGLSGATTLRHRDVIVTEDASFLFVSPHEPYVAPTGWLR